ncbi:hypothetical protein APY03_2403 [Variovorax sp. WDL1]|nr:hypothetical protein APY03_2403 [Variovorax sp. WDL1]
MSLGAGASLASLLTVFPQLIWISKHKALVFGLSAAMLLVAGYFQAKPASCPADRRLAAACVRQKLISRVVYGLAVAAYATGVFFAFVLPHLL